MDGRNLEEEDGKAEAKKAFEQHRCRGEELRRWQMQERAECLTARSA